MEKNKLSDFKFDKTTKTTLLALLAIIVLCVLVVIIFQSKEIFWTANFFTHQEDFNTTFSKELFSFNYPLNWEKEKEYSLPFVMVQNEYKEYYDIYFMATKDWEKMIIVMGSDANVNQDLNTLGEALAMIQNSPDRLVEQKGIIKSNNKIFYQMIQRLTEDKNNIRNEIMTFCQDKLIEIVILSKDNETKTLETIASSFECTSPNQSS